MIRIWEKNFSFRYLRYEDSWTIIVEQMQNTPHTLAGVFLLGHTAQRDGLGTEPQDDENHQRGQHGRHEVDARDHDGVPVAVVVDRVVGGIRDNGAVAQSQGEEDLSGRLTPHLHVPPDFHLRNAMMWRP